MHPGSDHQMIISLLFSQMSHLSRRELLHKTCVIRINGSFIPLSLLMPPFIAPFLLNLVELVTNNDDDDADLLGQVLEQMVIVMMMMFGMVERRKLIR